MTNIITPYLNESTTLYLRLFLCQLPRDRMRPYIPARTDRDITVHFLARSVAERRQAPLIIVYMNVAYMTDIDRI